ncbi:YqaA family protein [Herminiimonas aquatilis]|uniref:YqaA family protein n=1 Tax=Herminiimonas aquatilis TaxID=345342 RepID=A0ABW2J5R8_9BURK
MIEACVQWLLAFLAVPEIGLFSVFVISLVSATLLPMGSEPAVFAVIKANPSLFWMTILVATVGNTIGGVINYWMGVGAKQIFAKERQTRWFDWLQRFGPKTMLLAWLPGIGDPICLLAGWLKLPFWPCVAYMAVGKFLRYVTMTWLLLYVPDGVWQYLIKLF